MISLAEAIRVSSILLLSRERSFLGDVTFFYVMFCVRYLFPRVNYIVRL